MPANTGENVLDALLILGFHIEIDDDGTITATHQSQVLLGKAEHGSITWADRSQTFKVLEQAYIAKLRKRISDAQSERG